MSRLHISFSLLLLSACTDSGDTKADSPRSGTLPETIENQASPPEAANLVDLSDLGATGDTLLASAPEGFTVEDLGRPFTADFVRLQGSAGKSLFPTAQEPKRTAQTSMAHSSLRVESEAELAANASAWGVTLGALGADIKQRFSSHRAYQVVELVEVDDTTAAREPPDDAVYYPAKVHLGYSYEELVSGDSAEFSAEVATTLAAAKGNLSALAKSKNLQFRAIGRGLVPKDGGAIFADNPEELHGSYSTEGNPVPVLVEWRTIPGRTGRTGEFQWNDKKEGCSGTEGCDPCSRWRFNRVAVAIPKTKSNGKPWDAGGTPPEVEFTLTAGSKKQTMSFKGTALNEVIEPLLVAPGDQISFTAIDKDLASDDDIGSGGTQVAEFYPRDAESQPGNEATVKSDDGRTKVTLFGQCAT